MTNGYVACHCIGKDLMSSMHVSPRVRGLQAGMPAHGDADAPGAVQELLAGFLMRCPAGVVILEGADRLHPRLLPVWINALSEQVQDICHSFTLFFLLC